MTISDLNRDQAIRSEVYDALQAVFARYDLIVTPTVAAMPVENRDDGNTVGPSEVNGEAVDPLIGWCLTYPVNFTGHPACFDSRRHGRRPAGRHADHRPPLCRRRCVRRECNLRAAPALGRSLSRLRRAQPPAARSDARRGRLSGWRVIFASLGQGSIPRIRINQSARAAAGQVGHGPQSLSRGHDR